MPTPATGTGLFGGFGPSEGIRTLSLSPVPGHALTGRSRRRRPFSFTSQLERNKRLDVAQQGAQAHAADKDVRSRKDKAMETIVIVLLVLFLLGGGGYWYRSRRA